MKQIFDYKLKENDNEFQRVQNEKEDIIDVGLELCCVMQKAYSKTK
jgi:hypothetical protein